MLRVLDIATGNLMGETFVDTGQRSFTIVRATAVNKTLLISDNRNRTQAYTLDTDEPVGRQFGRLSSLDAKLGRICLENTDGDVSIYDGASMKEVAHFNFPAAVSYSGFSGDGQRLLVVTAQQKVYIQPLP